ncbi:hypothetical protein ABEV74_13920 [Paenibacillus cisolokensis]|jgi:hypothetical protein|uniref:Uncharacterized protein n=1 Tax=Paenibacillus cisolokensis TaxID=1658519 RepID=A0ABQ4NA82_9BACL|nr:MULTISPECIES: hypothetical protein [Paenibacillus]ALS25752.1 hypothetical protein IJ21_03150 [Paenibacillus sp. 32O-W]GIQ65144.1 hypothetical protein PACILC2_37120 [Paenibacillus cisolokensis]
MYMNGQMIYKDRHFQDHIIHQVPVQIYWGRKHSDIGFIDRYSQDYVSINNVYYSRKQFTFVSRPGY